MIRINLLPHREEARKQRRQGFYGLALGMIVLGALVGVVVSMIIGGFVDAQEAKNNFLKTEIAKLDKDIAEIKRLKGQINALLARKQVIESLQSHRAETVHLFNELARQTPEGVYLKSIKQEGLKVTLNGYAQSNARVSTLMRNLDGSEFLEKPNLIEVKSDQVDDRRVSNFTLQISLERKSDAEDEKGKGGRK
ncbi:PilN domain-containing protein [Nitrogeniibacter mangrovi]|uniref:PilN domain-containing protein n=1 Tax=Nitrogeniibacter mangrovi TaxID=2016596 RepID=A0A6C1AZN4_9RHOO|nr:PilN domain-containing protein [Nitrogeniibacter mangrovi]QID16787.1 PilN domain-containing protein [Nitrogeniibacter mangrovi]